MILIIILSIAWRAAASRTARPFRLSEMFGRCCEGASYLINCSIFLSREEKSWSDIRSLNAENGVSASRTICSRNAPSVSSVAFVYVNSGLIGGLSNTSSNDGVADGEYRGDISSSIQITSADIASSCARLRGAPSSSDDASSESEYR
ncbi:JM126 [macacine gammaherpesvirus 11]|uniref:JM126 n=2 Tax=macacine gammaherpesvirus 11 TaxID=2560570 RepID=G9JMD4_9GAMA|nr:JM126 [Macaca fuscata rhadinovirus]AAT00103.1 JM126 [Macaca fuscata rhadinovirus]AEW87651.1 JM126 [Macaca fuscata rhadinovirus]AEW87821.1 JM126 [Macaca fuscata rhadinovirus]